MKVIFCKQSTVGCHWGHGVSSLHLRHSQAYENALLDMQLCQGLHFLPGRDCACPSIYWLTQAGIAQVI